MFSKIVLPLDGSPVAEIALPYARALAQGLNLPVTLLSAIDLEEIARHIATERGQFLDTLVAFETHRRDEYLSAVANGFSGVPVKLAEQVLPYARLLADAYGAVVTLLRVSDPDARLPFSASQSASDYLNYTAASLQPLSVESVEKIGKPAEAIVDSAMAGTDCLIAMATHGVTGPRRWFLGSVASKVVQSAANPILLIRPVENGLSPATIALKRVVVPLDGSGLAEKVLPHVASLARKLKLEVQLVRAYALPLNAYLVADGVINQGPAQFRRSLHEECEKYLDGKVAGLRADGFDPVTATMIEGDAANEIVELAAGSPQCLVAMSTHGRSGVGRWVLGSVADKVVQHARAPVLLIRPSG